MDAIVLYPEVGKRSDPANPGGSLHAKMGDVKSLLNTINANVGRAPWAAGKSPVWLYGKYNTPIPENASVDVLTLSGPRIILGGHIITSASRYGTNKIILDGVEHRIEYSSDYYGDGQFLGEMIRTNRSIFDDYYFTGMADYRFFTKGERYANDVYHGGGIFTLPMMYINSGLTIRLEAYSWSNNTTKVIYNLFHTEA
jgi:hypothetical protein